MKKRAWLMAACVLALVLMAGHVRAQSSPTIGYGFTAPLVALPGQTVSVCAFDWLTGPVAAGPVTVTEQIIDVTIGAAIAQQSITLPISPFDPYHLSPCVQLKVPATATSPAGPGKLLVGAVFLYPPPADGTSGAPSALLTASVNVSGTSSAQTIPIPIQAVPVFGSPARLRP